MWLSNKYIYIIVQSPTLSISFLPSDYLFPMIYYGNQQNKLLLAPIPLFLNSGVEAGIFLFPVDFNIYTSQAAFHSMLPQLFSSSPCVDYIHICRNQTDAVVSCLPYSGSHGCVGKCVPESPHSGSAAVMLVMVCIWNLHSGGLPSRELPTSYKDL